MEMFENLSTEEKEILFKASAYVSILAANADGEMDEQEKKKAIEITHIKTYDSDPQLIEYYQEVELTFQYQIEQLDKELPKGKLERAKAIEKELEKLNTIIQKIGEPFSSLITKSLQSYTDHVSKAHRNSLEFFLIPFYIKGLTD